MANKPKKTPKKDRARKKQPSGHNPRGSRGVPRDKLATAAGFKSGAEITRLFSASEHNLKLVTILQKVLAELVKNNTRDQLENSPITHHYAGLILALSGSDSPTLEKAPEISDQTSPDPTEQRSRKQSGLAADALRQVVLEAVETPLAMLPSLLADQSLSDQEKLKRLEVYTRSLEMLYEPLQLEPIGDPGEKVSFDPRMHESAKELTAGDHCVITRIGFTKGDSVVRKAVVETKE
jgi:hypothetical protein